MFYLTLVFQISFRQWKTLFGGPFSLSLSLSLAFGGYCCLFGEGDDNRNPSLCVQFFNIYEPESDIIM